MRKLLLPLALIALTSFNSTNVYSQAKAEPDTMKTYPGEEVEVVGQSSQLEAKALQMNAVNSTLHGSNPLMNVEQPVTSTLAGGTYAKFFFRGIPSDYVSVSLKDNGSRHSNISYNVLGNLFSSRGLDTKLNSAMFTNLQFDELTSAGQTGPLGVVEAEFREFPDRIGGEASLQLLKEYGLVNWKPIDQVSLALYIDNNGFIFPNKKITDWLPRGNSRQGSAVWDISPTNHVSAKIFNWDESQFINQYYNSQNNILSQNADHNIFLLQFTHDLDEEKHFSVGFMQEKWSERSYTNSDDAGSSIGFGMQHYEFNAAYSDNTNTFGAKVTVLRNSTQKNVNLSASVIDNIFLQEIEQRNLTPELTASILKEYNKISDYDKVNKREEWLLKIENRYKELTGNELGDIPDYQKFRNDILGPPIIDSNIVGSAPTDISLAYDLDKRYLAKNFIIKFRPTVGLNILRNNYTVPIGAKISFLQDNSEATISYMYMPTTLRRNDLENVFANSAQNVKAQNYAVSYSYHPGFRLTATAYFKEYHDFAYGKSRGLELMMANDDKFSYLLAATVIESKTADHPTVGSIPGYVNLTLSQAVGSITFTAELSYQKGYWTDNLGNGYTELPDRKAISLGFMYTGSIVKEKDFFISFGLENAGGNMLKNVLYQDGQNIIYEPILPTLNIKWFYGKSVD